MFEEIYDAHFNSTQRLKSLSGRPTPETEIEKRQQEISTLIARQDSREIQVKYTILPEKAVASCGQHEEGAAQ
jgi:hypothetical protein